jgi:hypothetical protein
LILSSKKGEREFSGQIQTMETYVTTLLGLPTTLNDEDIDQDYPLCIGDEWFQNIPLPAQSESLQPETLRQVKNGP